MFEFDGCVLLIVFFDIGLKLFGDVAGVDSGFYAWVSFGKEHQFSC